MRVDFAKMVNLAKFQVTKPNMHIEAQNRSNFQKVVWGQGVSTKTIDSVSNSSMNTAKRFCMSLVEFVAT